MRHHQITRGIDKDTKIDWFWGGFWGWGVENGVCVTKLIIHILVIHWLVPLIYKIIHRHCNSVNNCFLIIVRVNRVSEKNKF